MQNAKDSFYETLRDRLARLNPERTVVVRDVTRPALIVDENETPSVAALPDCFHVRWIGTQSKDNEALPLVVLTCELFYETAGSGWNGGLDRGRVLATMDAELTSALTADPQNAAKLDYSGLANGGAAKQMTTRLWWASPEFDKVVANRDRIGRTATVSVMSYSEPGELS